MTRSSSHPHQEPPTSHPSHAENIHPPNPTQPNENTKPETEPENKHSNQGGGILRGWVFVARLIFSTPLDAVVEGLGSVPFGSWFDSGGWEMPLACFLGCHVFRIGEGKMAWYRGYCQDTTRRLYSHSIAAISSHTTASLFPSHPISSYRLTRSSPVVKWLSRMNTIHGECFVSLQHSYFAAKQLARRAQFVLHVAIFSRWACGVGLGGGETLLAGGVATDFTVR
ncbi:hypothetical protein BKA64DRAFT_345468 [Cadophora sp. MPI-SDFR-AT-0126]|nr:hypothetical protein BKA64DRAFT_345468 [Leotiomycetes sp. MPI-SDFR-AT-0126]